MLYKIVKLLFFFTTKAYFRSIFVQGEEFIPKNDKPVIFAVNHPSSFMDPIILGVKIKKPLYFLARGDIFKNKMVSRLFDKLHMIPVYKPDVSPDLVDKNEMIFEKCYTHLSKSKTIMVFPEGISKTELRLRPIKTGLARIAFGAEEKYNFNLDLTIIPIGLNYSNPHSFKSDVFINIGEPIQINDYKDAFLKDNKQGVIQLTERVKVEMEKCIIVVEDDRFKKLIKQIEILYRSKLRQYSKVEDKATQDFRLSQDIVEAVEYFAKKHPEVLKEFEPKITYYLKQLKRLKLRDSQIKSSSISLNLVWKILYLILGFPLFLFGLLTNYIPFKLAERISEMSLIREDFVGSIKLAAGMLIFLILFCMEASIFGAFTSKLWGLLFFITLYPAGLFTIDYFKTYFKTRGTIKFLRIFMRKSELVASLKTTRQELIDELEKRKIEFLAQR